MSKLLECRVDSSTLLILRTHWRVIFGKVIRCSTLRLWVGLTISILRLCSFNGCLKLDSHLSEKPFFFYFYENPLKMMKNAFCLILKAFFVLKIFFFYINIYTLNKKIYNQQVYINMLWYTWEQKNIHIKYKKQHKNNRKIEIIKTNQRKKRAIKIWILKATSMLKPWYPESIKKALH